MVKESEGRSEIKHGFKIGADIQPPNAVVFRQRANDYRQNADYQGAHSPLGKFYRRMAKEHETLAENLYALDHVLSRLHSTDKRFLWITEAPTQSERLQRLLVLAEKSYNETFSAQGLVELLYEFGTANDSFFTEAEDVELEDILEFGLIAFFSQIIDEESATGGMGIVVDAD